MQEPTNTIKPVDVETMTNKELAIRLYDKGEISGEKVLEICGIEPKDIERQHYHSIPPSVQSSEFQNPSTARDELHRKGTRIEQARRNTEVMLKALQHLDNSHVTATADHDTLKERVIESIHYNINIMNEVKNI